MSWKSAGFALLLITLLVVSLYRAKDGARQSEAHIAALQIELNQAIETRQELLETLEDSAAREWLEAYARDELGMSPVSARQIVNELNIDAVLGPAATSGPTSLTTPPEEGGTQ